MRPAQVDTKIISSIKDKTNYQWTIKFTNNSDQLAFFINPQLSVREEEIMPTFWSKNYFSLLPKESVTVTVSCPVAKINGMEPALITAGWNVSKTEMKMK